MTDPETPLRTLHQQFCKLAGTTKPVYEQWRYDWNTFRKFYTADDMALVFKYAERINQQRQERYRIVLTIAKLLDLQNFDSLLAEADLDERKRAAKRREVLPSAGGKALAEFRRTEPVVPEQPVKRVSLETIAEAVRRAK